MQDDRLTIDQRIDTMGVTASGQAHVEDRAVRLEIELPWMLAMLAGPMQRVIEQQGRRLIGSR